MMRLAIEDLGLKRDDVQEEHGDLCDSTTDNFIF